MAPFRVPTGEVSQPGGKCEKSSRKRSAAGAPAPEKRIVARRNVMSRMLSSRFGFVEEQSQYIRGCSFVELIVQLAPRPVSALSFLRAASRIEIWEPASYTLQFLTRR